MSAKRIDKLLNNQATPLGRLVRQAGESVSLTERVRHCLPAEIGARLTSASMRDPATLVLAADSPAWSARLRYQVPELMAALRRDGLEFSTIEIRVALSE